jgi:hypothetical protein
LRRALCFLLACQNGLQDIAGFGDVGKVDLGTIVLLGARCGRRSGPGAAFEVPTHLFGLAGFDGTRMGLAFGESQISQSIEDLFTLDFQLTRQIVNSNLTQSASFRCPALLRLTGHSNLAAR